MNNREEVLDESEVLDDIFGAASEEEQKEIISENSSQEEETYESDDDEKKSSNKKSPKKDSIEKDSEANGTDGIHSYLFPIIILNLFSVLDKILEARRDFEEALSKIKGGRRKRDSESDSVVYKTFTQNLLL